MHIVDGALSLPVLISGGVLTASGVAVGLQRLQIEQIPQAAVLSAVFFVASLVHIPLGPSSVHLVMNGLMGVILGWAAFPALLIALLLQAVFFGFGGLLVLGVNTFNMTLPALISFYVCNRPIRASGPRAAFVWGVVAGALAVFLASLMVGFSLAVGGQEFFTAAQLVVISNLPIMALEGLLTGAAVVLMRKVKPEVFRISLGAAA